MNIDILYFAGCPNFRPTLELVRRVVHEHGLEAVIREIEVKSAEEAARLRFFGSPTIQVDGGDADPAAREQTEFSFSCRFYGAAGVIPEDLLRRALLAGRA